MKESHKNRYRSFIRARMTELQEYLDAAGLIPAVKILTQEQIRHTMKP